MSAIRLDLNEARPLLIANLSASVGVAVHPDRITDYHDFLYIEEGEWEVCEEEQVFLLRPGDLLTLAAGRHHYGRVPCARGTRWIYIHVPAHKNDRFVEHPSPPRDAGDPDDMTIELPSLIHTRGRRHIQQLLRDIVHCYWSSLRINRQRARIMLSDLLMNLVVLAGPAQDSSRATPIENVIRHIERYPNKTFSIDELAELAHMSRRLLTRKFRELTRTSVRQYQLDLKIRIARSMLADNPGVRVKEIAHALGFFDEFHFSKAFKSVVKTAPRSFRQESAHSQKKGR